MSNKIDKNNETDKTKKLFLKILIAVLVVLTIALFTGGFSAAWFVSEKAWEIIYTTLIFTILGLGVLIVILCVAFGVLKQPPVKAEKVASPFASYSDLDSFLQKTLPENNYCLQKTVPISEDGEISVYAKQSGLSTLKCFVVVRVSEWTEALFDPLNAGITSCLEYFCGGEIRHTVKMIAVFCVDRATPDFQELVNSNIMQSINFFKLPVGISFDEKNIYIAKQKDGFAIAQYKKLRQVFIKIMNLQIS